MIDESVMKSTLEKARTAKAAMWESLKAQRKSGFFDLPKDTRCTHPGHRPPTHLHIPQGKGYRHVCPGCGWTAHIVPPQVVY